MREFRVLSALDAAAAGPIRRRDRKPVHLRQGDADAACGPYCLFMALLTLGLVEDRDHLGPGYEPDDQGTQTLLAKLAGRRWGGLFPGGMELSDLRDLLVGSYPNQVGVDGPSAGGMVCSRFAVKHLQQDHPLIVQIAFGGDSHFVVAVGLAVDEDKPTWLLTLDPRQPASPTCPWNGLVALRGVAGRDSTWRKPTGGEQRVTFKGAVALFRKDA